jgi:hypothetical protein
MDTIIRSELDSQITQPWNKGKLTGAKPPLRPKHVRASGHTHPLMDEITREFAGEDGSSQAIPAPSSAPVSATP